MSLKRRTLLLSAASLSLVSSARYAFAQVRFPSKPIKLIVPFAPGGTNDIIGRLLAPKLGALLGQPVLVDNKGGAGGAIGVQAAARAEPNGHTILLASSTTVINPYLIKESGYDWRADFTPVSMVTQFPLVLVVNPSLPVKTVPEFLKYARAKGGDLFVGSAGTGSTQHLVAEMFNSMAGTKMTHVPYKGNGPAIAALLAGDIQVFFGIVPDAVNLGSAGKIRPLAVTSMTRSASLPNLPTLNESGVPNFDSTPWICFLLPKGAPASVVQQWVAVIWKVLADKELQGQLAKMGFETVGSSPKELGAYMELESAKWGKVIADAGIKSD